MDVKILSAKLWLFCSGGDDLKKQLMLYDTKWFWCDRDSDGLVQGGGSSGVLAMYTPRQK